ncbi:MAG: hypothetical protein IPH13_20295 [Planctomycetes bacterium]|nr:hypothetical protein [Planctomycetota bacterium]
MAWSCFHTPQVFHDLSDEFSGEIDPLDAALDIVKMNEEELLRSPQPGLRFVLVLTPGDCPPDGDGEGDVHVEVHLPAPGVVNARLVEP